MEIVLRTQADCMLVGLSLSAQHTTTYTLTRLNANIVHVYALKAN